jgi:hypothetical protein
LILLVGRLLLVWLVLLVTQQTLESSRIHPGGIQQQ